MSAVESLTGRTFAQIATSDPGFANYTYYLIRTFDFSEAGLLAYLVVVSVTAYRRGERWAWYLTWLLPGLIVLDLPYEFLVRGFIDVNVVNVITIAILVAGLLLPYRKFFPKKQSITP